MSEATAILKHLTIAATGAAIMMMTINTASYADPPRWSNGHRYERDDDHAYVRHGRRHQRPRVIYVERRERYDTDPGYRRSAGIGAENGGRILGAIIGAATGTQFGKGAGRTVAILGGAVIGAVLGGEIGRSMQASDRAQTQYALETVPTGQSTAWKNPDTGSRYKVIPTRTYKTDGNQDCRDFTTWAVIDGYEEQVHGTACRQADGSWKQTKI